MKAHDGQYPGVWTASQMPSPCNGTLFVSEENNSISLVLNRQYEEVDWEYRRVIHEVAFPFIEGELFTGARVTLLHCRFAGGDTPFGGRVTEHFYADFACWDISSDSGEAPVFTGGIFDLGEWVQWAGLSYVAWLPSENENETLISLYENGPIEQEIGPGTSITIYTEARTPFMRSFETQVTIGQWAKVAFSYVQDRPWRDVYSDATWFCRFVEIGKGSFVSINEARCVRALDESVGEVEPEEGPFPSTSPVSIGVGRNPYTSREPHPSEYPFKLSDALECGALTVWFDKRESLEPIVGLLSLAFSGGIATASALFLNLMQALEALHSRFYAATLGDYRRRVQQLCDACRDSSLHDYLCDSGQQRGRGLYLKSRLNDLLWAEGARPVEPRYCRFNEYGGKLKDTRNYYTHYGERSLDNSFSKDVLPMVNVELMALLTYHLMVILGFEEQFAKDAVRRRFRV